MSTLFPATPSMEGRSPTVNWVMMISVAALAVSLVVAFYYLLTEGHAAYNTHNYGITWGLGVSAYVYLVLVSTGLTFVASLAMMFRFNDFYPITKRCVWLAIVTLVAGFATLALEIGHPFRMLWALPSGLQYASPMFWMGVFYTLYLGFLAWKFQRVQVGDWSSRLSRNLGIASFVSVIVAHGNLGLLFGMMWLRPVWHDYMLPVYFLVTAGLSGVAFAVFFTYLAYDFDRKKMPEALRALASGTALPNVFATLIGVTLFMVTSRTISGLWSNLDGLQVYHQIVRSPLYHVELWLGLVLPFALMLWPPLKRRPSMQITAAALVMVTVFIGRYEFIVSGQMVPVFKGTWVPGLIEYTPSLTEWMVTLIGISLVFVLYTLGERLLSLGDYPTAETTEDGRSYTGRKAA
jgi:molybdopterin-containing oxidoreductase family membrane subunit